MRSDDLLIAITALNLGEHVLQAVAQSGTFGQPQRQTLTHIVREGEELHLLANLAVVAFLGFLEHHQIVVEHLLLGEGDAIHAHQLRTLLVATPVSSGKRQYLDGLDGFGGGDVRATAQVGEIALLIGGDVAVFQFADKFALQRLSAVAKEFECVGLADVAAHHVLFFGHEFGHLLLDFFKVGTGNGVFARVNVVVEAIFDGGTDTELNTRIKFLKRFGQQVGRSVPKGVLAFSVLPLEQFNLAVVTNGSRYIPFFIIDRSSQNVAGKARTDAFGNLQRGYAAFVLLDVSVRKFNVNHLVKFFSFCHTTAQS